MQSCFIPVIKMADGPLTRLRELENIEKDIATSIHNAGLALQELAKDKPVLKNVESHTTNFMKTLMDVEKKLTTQINYLTQVSTGQPHEGSSYAAHKDLLLGNHRMDHIRSRLQELERIHIEHQQQQQQIQRQLAFSKSLQAQQQQQQLQQQQQQTQMGHS